VPYIPVFPVCGLCALRAFRATAFAICAERVAEETVRCLINKRESRITKPKEILEGGKAKRVGVCRPFTRGMTAGRPE